MLIIVGFCYERDACLPTKAGSRQLLLLHLKILMDIFESRFGHF